MAKYDYKCSRCGVIVTHNVSFEDRLAESYCECGGSFEYQFPVSAALGFRPFEPYYHEGLDMDIHGRKEQKEILSAYGLVEAGDKVNGAREEERSVRAQKITRQPPRGITLADKQRQAEKQRRLSQTMEVGVRFPDGGAVPKRKVADLPSAIKGR